MAIVQMQESKLRVYEYGVICECIMQGKFAKGVNMMTNVWISF